ncbi:hypothetical protein F4781DRAFT_382427 [Annulohypoxylon bovei var. microspora]|nr:hypothetical protein F4781DRAFT_382427 [Annulohypoxylon bovei var. microspora]
MWKVVLLINEANLFLEVRSSDNLEHNELVLIFHSVIDPSNRTINERYTRWDTWENNPNPNPLLDQDFSLEYIFYVTAINVS